MLYEINIYRLSIFTDFFLVDNYLYMDNEIVNKFVIYRDLQRREISGKYNFMVNIP